MRRPERLAETRGDVAQAPALCLELVEACLELEGHLVERATEQREFVSTLNGHALLQIPACDCVSCVDQASDRAHDRSTFDVGHAGDEDESGDEADEQLLRRLSVGGVDEPLRTDDAERRVRAVVERSRDQSPVLRPPERDGAGLAGTEIDGAGHARWPGDDLAVFDQKDVVSTLEA